MYIILSIIIKCLKLINFVNTLVPEASAVKEEPEKSFTPEKFVPEEYYEEKDYDEKL